MRAVVTGGCGFIGSHMVDLLVEGGHEVVIVDDLSTGSLANANADAELVRVDIRDLDLLGRTFAGADYVFHMAALARIQPSFDDPLSHEDVNVVGTINCHLAARAAGVKRLVFSGSSSIYGNPRTLPTPETEPVGCLSPYALQKFAAEQYCLLLGERSGLSTVVLRYFNVYGPRSFNPANPYNAYTSVVGIFHFQRQSRQPLTITGDGQQARDFVHTRDVARANFLAATVPDARGVYNVGGGSAITVLDLAHMFGGPIVHIPERKGEARVTLADITRIKSDLGWFPEIDLVSGIASMEQEARV